jgi:hypothetical protein
MTSDVQSVRVTSTGSAFGGPARVRNISVLVGATAGRLTLTDGNGGATLIDIDLSPSLTHSIDIADAGVRFESSIYVATATNVTAATIFYS